MVAIKQEIEICPYLIPGIIKEDKPKSIIETNIRKAKKIIENICGAYEISFDEVKSKTRKSEVIYTRQWCIYFSLTETGISLESLGNLFNRHYSTMIHSRDEVKKYLTEKFDNQYKQDYPLLKKIALYGIEKDMGRPEKRRSYRKEIITKVVEEEMNKPIIRPKAVYSNKQWN